MVRIRALLGRLVHWLAAQLAKVGAWLTPRLTSARDWLCARWPVCKWIAVAADDEEPTRRRRRGLWALSLAGALASLFTLRQVDEILAAMHKPGDGTFRISSLSDVSFHVPSIENARSAIEAWVAASDPGVTGPMHLVGWYLIADALFAVSYTVIAVLVLRSGQRTLEYDTAGGSLRDARITVAKAGQAFAVLLLVADLLEDVSIGLFVPKLAGVDGAWSVLPAQALFVALATATALKWVFALLLLACIVAVGAGVLAYIRRSPKPEADERGVTPTTLRNFWETLTTLRVQVAAVLVFGLFLLGPGAEQLADVIRRWNSGDWDGARAGIAALLMTGWLCVVIYLVSWRALVSAGHHRRSFTAPYFMGLALAGLLAIAVGLIADSRNGIVVGGGIALGLALLSTVQAPDRHDRDPRTPGLGGGFLPPLLTVLPLVLLGLAAAGAGLGELLYAKRLKFLLLVIAGLALQYVGWQLYRTIRPKFDPQNANLGTMLKSHKESDTPKWHRPWWYASLVGAVLLCGWVWFFPWNSGDWLGAVGVLAGFSIVLIFVGYAAVWVEQQFRAPAFLSVLGFRRIPVFVLAALWLAVSTQLDKGGYHDVRRIAYEGGPAEMALVQQGTGAVPRLGSVERKWNAWAKARGLEPKKAKDGPQQVIPLVLVASEGGGIRAAFWTADVLDCVADHAAECDGDRRGPRTMPAGSIFAASGISGGSLGLVAYVAHSTSGSDADDSNGEWVEKRLGDDYLTAAWSRMLFVDTPNAFLRLDPDDDRASMLEKAWERSWDDLPDNPLEQGLFSLSWKEPDQPLLLLNGTSVQDGCRVNTSVLDADIEGLRSNQEVRLRDCRSIDAFESGSLNPDRKDWVFGATHDLRDFLCSEDVRLSTGALLSARFPYVTPAGRVAHCNNPDIAIFVVDGGYFDTSAASPIVELWAELEPHVDRFNRETPAQCVVPFFLQIDNHYKETKSLAEIRRPSELTVPITAVRQARDARENDARQTAALEFDGPFGPYQEAQLAGSTVKRYAHVYPRAHPGTSAPLGWTLSEASIKDLRAQLVERLANTLELAEIKKWFDPGLRCVASG